MAGSAGNPEEPDTTSPAGPDTMVPAGYARRFGALLLDWVLCLLLAGFIARPPYTGFWAYPVLIVEYGFFLGLFGQTVGMRLARVRCVSVTGGPLGIPRALLRGFLLCLIVPPLIIGAGGRGLHDKAVGSIMVAA